MGLLNVEIEDSLLRDFRRFAVEKRGKIYGVLKPEIEQALRTYLEASKKKTQEENSQTPELHASSVGSRDQEVGK